MEIMKKRSFEKEKSLNSYDNTRDTKLSEDESFRPAPEQLKKKVWTEDEEVAILNSAIKFSVEQGLCPTDDMCEFFKFVRKILDPVEFSKRQLSAKLRRLKVKFEKNVNEGRVASSLHEKQLFELSKIIWGSCIPDISLLCENEISFLDEKLVGLGEDIVAESMELIGETKRKQLVEQWKELHVMELKVCLKKAQLLEVGCKMLLDASRG